ncbi:MAG: hypothetical protein LBT26_09540 [Clostridiales Family XIII bacterium]|jgi:hypothetical protein|nr:hypothetical protein [Clostridiales Family XIII bacterium]
MDIDALLELLEIDSPDEFTFFEHYAELAEYEEEIPFDTLYRFFSLVDAGALAELTESYFEDVLAGIPDDQIDFYTLVATIGRNLAGLAKNFDVDRNLDLYTEEFFRFHAWYLFDGVVRCVKKDKPAAKTDVSICESLALSRLEKLGDDEYSYDYSGCMDYPLEEYVFPLVSYDEDEDEEEEEAMIPDDYVREGDL